MGQTNPELKVGKLSLFSSKTCPNCRVAMMLLDKAGIPYTKLDAVENREMALRYIIKKIPTLVDVRGDDIRRYAGIADIKCFLQSQVVKT